MSVLWVFKMQKGIPWPHNASSNIYSSMESSFGVLKELTDKISEKP